jgi:hypothetical protein
MAPNTRSTTRSSTPPYRFANTEWHTPLKSRFFTLYDKRDPSQSERSICEFLQVPRSTARHWLSQRDRLGSPAKRKTRKLSQNMGRPCKVSKEVTSLLISPSRNRVRDQPLPAQIRYHNLSVSERTLQRAFSRNTNKASLYKQAYVQKEISEQNHGARWEYGV